jgi:hypothetical protein
MQGPIGPIADSNFAVRVDSFAAHVGYFADETQ